jgi:L-cysteate sulfo-lyase
LAQTEGLILDPVYTAKAMAALIDWVRKSKLTENDNVMFWHTGGQLALFYTPEKKEGGQGDKESHRSY